MCPHTVYTHTHILFFLAARVYTHTHTHTLTHSLTLSHTYTHKNTHTTRHTTRVQKMRHAKEEEEEEAAWVSEGEDVGGIER